MPGSARLLGSLLAVAAVLSTLASCDGGGDIGPGQGGAQADEQRNEASDIGVTEDTILLGGHFPVAGPAAGDVPRALAAYFEHVNDHGGVSGRRIEYVVQDDADGPADPVDAVRELVVEDRVFAIVGGLESQRAVQDFLNGEGVPDLFVSSGSLRRGANPADHPYTFGWQPDHLAEGKVIGSYLAEELPDARVGLFLQDDELGRDGEAGVREYVGDDRIVAVQRHPAGTTDVGPQIAALAASGADVVVGMTGPAPTALSQLRAAELGFTPQWIYSYAGTVPAAGPLDGVLTTRYLPTVAEPDDPWIQLFRRIWDAYGGEGALTDDGVHGMSIAYTAVQALQAAGRNPTRERLIEAVEQVGGDFEGPVRAPFRYSQDSHLGAGGLAIGRLDGGVLVELGPVVLSDTGDAGVDEWYGEVPGPPENGIPDEEFYE